MIYCFVVGIEAAVRLVNQCSSQAGSGMSNWTENNVLWKRLPLNNLQFYCAACSTSNFKLCKTIKTCECPKLSCSLPLPGKETASCCGYKKGLVEVTLFSEKQKRKFFCWQKQFGWSVKIPILVIPEHTTQRCWQFVVWISNAKVASTKQTPRRMKWNVRGSAQKVGQHREKR